MAISAKIMKDGVDAVTVANVFGGMPTFHAPSGKMIETAHHVPRVKGDYQRTVHDILRINKGTAFTIDDGTTVHRVVFTADSDFDPLKNLDVNSEGSADSLEHGRDYYVYACVVDGEVSIVVSESSTVPEGDGYSAENTRKIGGFHYGTVRCVSPTGTPIDSDGNEWGISASVPWTQNVVPNMVVPNSVWDLTDTNGGLIPHEDGTVAVGGSWKADGYGTHEGKYDRRGCRMWVYIYLASLKEGAFNHGTQSGTAAKNDPIGGDFTVGSYYGATPLTGTEGLSGYNFIEIAQKKGLRLLSYEEWLQCAYGNPEGEQSGDNYGWTKSANAARAKTGCSVTSATDGAYSDNGIKKFAVSAWNICDCVGNVWEWLSTFVQKGGTGTFDFHDVAGNYVGSIYEDSDNSLTQFLAGGNWIYGSDCGCRAVALSSYPWDVNARNGSRFARDAL